MKKRNANKFLLPLVGLIWIGVLARIFWPAEEAVRKPAIPASSQLEFAGEAVADTLSLSLAYADPFLQTKRPVRRAVSTQLNASEVARRSAAAAAKKPQPVPAPIDWGFVQYKGLAQVSNGAHQTALLHISGESVFLEAGQLHRGLKLVAIEGDSVEVEFRGERVKVGRK